jgi:(S)-2-hydroxyglutarate dehydrogenase
MQAYALAAIGGAGVARFDLAPDVAIIQFWGDFYSLKPEAGHLTSGLIDPVPDPTLPFLDVKQIGGAVWAGRNAVMSPSPAVTASFAP